MEALRSEIMSDEGNGRTCRNLMFYLSIPPSLAPVVVKNLGAAGLGGRERGHRRDQRRGRRVQPVDQRRHGAAVVVVQRIGQEAVTEQPAAPAQQCQAPVGVALRAADFQQDVAEVASRMIAPTLVVEQGGGDKTVPSARIVPTIGEIGAAPAVVVSTWSM